MNYAAPPSTMELLERPAPPAIIRPAAIVLVPAHIVRILEPRPGWLTIPRLGFAAPVGGSYGSCAGPIGGPPAYIARWTCAPTSGIWLIGHNPGIFTPITRLRAGDVVYEGRQAYRVANVVVTGRYSFPAVSGALILQTCLRADSSIVLIVEANPIG